MTTVPEEPAADPATEPGPSPDDVETAELVKDDDVLSEAAGIVDDVAERALEPQDVTAMDALDAPRRLLLVHAHPDDETIGNGATMARYASSGAVVTLVTCTRGERGEVIPPELAHLEGDGPALAERRTHELATAMEALGVGDHRFLDDAPLAGEDASRAAGAHYEDSGMAWGEGRVAVPAPDTPPDAFALADVDEAAARLAGVLREVRPQVVVTYEPGGGYGHPDHVQAHRVAVRAVELAADPGAPAVAGSEPWEVAKVYETVVPRSVVGEALRGGPLPSAVVDDDEVTTVVEAEEHLPAKLAALRAHATQVRVEGGSFALSTGVSTPVVGTEHYRLARGAVAPDADRADGRESDLFAGVAPGSGASGSRAS
jgi:N-acetyl-1-D-myo-inositol-2-amino-2-deoxy-alpha-D-glucopyranoside deacetylase